MWAVMLEGSTSYCKTGSLDFCMCRTIEEQRNHCKHSVYFADKFVEMKRNKKIILKNLKL